MYTQKTAMQHDKGPRPEDQEEVRLAAQALHETVARASETFLKQVSLMPFDQVLRQWDQPAKTPSRSETHQATGCKASNSAVESVKQSLTRIDRSELGAQTWTYLDREGARSRAQALDQIPVEQRGDLHGMTVGLKDMFDRTGWTARWGSQIRDQAQPALDDAVLTQKLEHAGVVVLGLQHMAEVALSPTGFNEWLEPGRNPCDHEHVSGGSSSGGGMSVGDGQVDIAMGSDTGGSIRLPAAFCGVVGLKPTQYRLNAIGTMPLSPNLDCLGPLTRDVQTCAAAFGVLDGQYDRVISMLHHAKGQEFRVAVPKLTPSDVLSGDMYQVFIQTTSHLRDLGMTIIEVDLPDLGLYGQLGSVVLSGEASAIHRHDLRHRPQTFGNQVYRRLARGLLLSANDYYDAIRMRSAVLQDFMQTTLHDTDALLLPTAPDVAPRISDTVGTDYARLEREFSALSWWTRGINYLGVPAIAVPVGRGHKNLPLSVQFVGRPMGDETILAMAYLLEQHLNLQKDASRKFGDPERQVL